jgi:hypothetical protein
MATGAGKGTGKAKVSGVLGFQGPTPRRGEPLQDYAGPVLGRMCPASGTDDIADWGFSLPRVGGGGDCLLIFTLTGVTMRQKSFDHPNASLVG